MMTKTMLNQEWVMSLDQAIEVRGPGPGHLHADRRTSARAYEAFAAKREPVFEGN